MAGKLVPSDQEGKEVEVTKEVSLMNKTKKELVEIIEAEELKYKKLKTTHNNFKKKVETQIADAVAEAIEATAAVAQESIDLANNEAATMSENLRIKNQQLNGIRTSVTNFVMQLGINLETFQKVLQADGVYIGGE